MKPLPPKQTLLINGQILEYVCVQNGQPSIVLINGAGGPMEGWYRLFPKILNLGTVFAYNRLGIDGSSRPNTPQTGMAIVTALHDLLVAAGLPAPYVLVGHSLGGLYANLFTRLYPQEVAGVVLLDATAPQDEAMLRQYRGGMTRWMEKLFSVVDAIFGKNPFGEREYVSETVRQIEQAGPFPDVPLIVVTGGKRPPSWMVPSAAQQIRSENQKSLRALSRHGKQVIASLSGHFPQLTQPDFVAEAIQEAVEWPLDEAVWNSGLPQGVEV